MSEVSARNTLRKNFLQAFPYADWQRIESPGAPGVPDINVFFPGIGNMWLEAKLIEELPKRFTTPVRIPYRTGQVLWLNKRKSLGDNVFTILRLKRDWLVYDNHFSRLEIGVSQTEIYTLCLAPSLETWFEILRSQISN